MDSPAKFEVKSRLWISADDGTFLGEGRVALLEEIQKHGSISKAAKEMGMSYKKAWRLVDSMNKLGSTPLVVQKVGGKGGGGTELSEAGIKAIAFFNQLRKEQELFLDSKSDQLDF